MNRHSPRRILTLEDSVDKDDIAHAIVHKRQGSRNTRRTSANDEHRGGPRQGHVAKQDAIVFPFAYYPLALYASFAPCEPRGHVNSKNKVASVWDQHRVASPRMSDLALAIAYMFMSDTLLDLRMVGERSRR